MGSTTFLLPKSLSPAAIALLEQACFAGGYDQTPVPTLSEVEGDKLYVSRAMSESGFLLVPWTVEPFGTIITTTSTLRERTEPYSLLVEMARGKLNQVRTQTAEWQQIGLQTTAQYDQELRDVARLFGKAALDPQADDADSTAFRVLERSYFLADQLVTSYVDQVFATRHHEAGPIDTRLAARFNRAPAAPLVTEYVRSFNAARIGFRWRDVEPVEAEFSWTDLDASVDFAQRASLPITGGSIIDLESGMLPEWASGWRGDLPTLAAFMCDYLEHVIERYRDTIRRWVICSGFNHADSLELSDDDRLRLAARLFEAAQAIDPTLELVLGITQPWGDYLVNEDQTISPLAFADDLIRSGVRVSAVELDIRIGTTPRGSWPRDRLDLSRLLELYAVLGHPLEVLLSTPGSQQLEIGGTHLERMHPSMWYTPPTPEKQAGWGSSFASLCLCKMHVQTVTWDHWQDGDDSITPSGGLIEVSGQPRPLLARLRAIRSEHLR